MKTQPAPSFNAAGSFLSASYTLDFGADLQHIIPCEGTWQGDRKKALSLYVDNYANNFSINVTGGNLSAKVPAYTSGFVDVKSYSDIFIAADDVGKVVVSLSTEPTAPGFTSRGVAPATNIITPLSISGSINLTQSNGPQSGYNAMVYSPLNNCIYIWGQQSYNVVVVDCATNKVVKVWKPAASYVGKYGVYYEGKIYFSFGTSYLCIIDCATNTSVFRDLGITNGFTRLCIHEAENMLYIGSGGITNRVPLNFSSAATPVRMSNTGQSNFDMGFTQYSKKDSCIYGYVGVDTIGGIARIKNGFATTIISAGYTLGGVYIEDTDTICFQQVGDPTYGYFYERNLKTGETNMVTMLVGSAVSTMVYSQSTGYVYNMNGDVYDTVLHGTIGKMPGTFNGNYGGVYCPSNGFVYRMNSSQNAFLDYGK